MKACRGLALMGELRYVLGRSDWFDVKRLTFAKEFVHAETVRLRWRQPDGWRR